MGRPFLYFLSGQIGNKTKLGNLHPELLSDVQLRRRLIATEVMQTDRDKLMERKGQRAEEFMVRDFSSPALLTFWAP